MGLQPTCFILVCVRHEPLWPDSTCLRINPSAGSAAILFIGGLDVIRKEAWPFHRTISGVRLCWELEEPKGPKEQLRSTDDVVCVDLKVLRYNTYTDLKIKVHRKRPWCEGLNYLGFISQFAARDLNSCDLNLE